MRYFAIIEFNNCFIISFDHCSFDQLNMSNHSLPAQGTDLWFSHNRIVSIRHDQNVICGKALFCMQLFAGHVVSFRLMK